MCRRLLIATQRATGGPKAPNAQDHYICYVPFPEATFQQNLVCDAVDDAHQSTREFERAQPMEKQLRDSLWGIVVAPADRHRCINQWRDLRIAHLKANGAVRTMLEKQAHSLHQPAQGCGMQRGWNAGVGAVTPPTWDTIRVGAGVEQRTCGFQVATEGCVHQRCSSHAFSYKQLNVSQHSLGRTVGVDVHACRLSPRRTVHGARHTGAVTKAVAVTGDVHLLHTGTRQHAWYCKALVVPLCTRLATRTNGCT